MKLWNSNFIPIYYRCANKIIASIFLYSELLKWLAPAVHKSHDSSSSRSGCYVFAVSRYSFKVRRTGQTLIQSLLMRSRHNRCKRLRNVSERPAGQNSNEVIGRFFELKIKIIKSTFATEGSNSQWANRTPKYHAGLSLRSRRRKDFALDSSIPQLLFYKICLSLFVLELLIHSFFITYQLMRLDVE